MIKEPVFHYREYLVGSDVEYLPCLPTREGTSPITRIPSGTNITFLSKVDECLFKVRYTDRFKREYVGLVIQSALDCLLPIRRR